MAAIARACRMVMVTVAALLAAFLILDSAANSAVAQSSSRGGQSVGSSYTDASRTAASRTVEVLPTGERDLEGRRPSHVPLAVPAPHGKHGSVCECDAGRPGTPVRYAATAATAAQRSGAGVSLSGELSITLQTFRC
ncbi:hypothetical protein [Streptomyces palmae]|uniref:Uncharacterized protein n=1 Tax=Streptomyces palmae TaxID=1701085 RepID=A0A4Z0FUE2_9ACTN|nr:hypothetical protein [Streptomyces palmae]TGA86778.1 hypothetical protein E4099_30315 [Streptomyces palmae]